MRRNTILLGLYVIAAAIIIMVVIGTNTGGATDTDNSYMDDATYVGSDSCNTGCHASSIYDSWQSSLHPKKIREASTVTVVPDFDGTTVTLSLSDTVDVNISLSIESDDYYVDLGSGYKYKVSHVLGGEGWKQRYVTSEVTGSSSKYILPIQWNLATSEWVAYHATDWYNATTGNPKAIAVKQSWDRRCSGCHTTGVEVTYANEEWTATYSELGIGCEGCHGPGSAHIASGSNKTATIWKSINSTTCGNCHNRGSSIGELGGETMGFPMDANDNVIKPGDDISLFYVDGAGLYDDGETSRQHHQQYVDYIGHTHSTSLSTITESDHGQDSCLDCHSTDYKLADTDSKPTLETAKHDIECSACHEPHGSSIDHDLRVSKETVCTQCHNGGDSVPGDSVHHPQAEIVAGTIPISGLSGSAWMGGVTCTDCHMPLVAKSAVNYDIASHTFHFISPEKSIDYDMPNSCTVSCHKDDDTGGLKTNEEAVLQLNEEKNEIETKLAAVNIKLTTAKEALDGADASSDTFNSANETYINAVFARDYVESDATMAHNPEFALELLNYADSAADEVISSLETKTPGFEAIIFIAALGVVFILLRKRK